MGVGLALYRLSLPTNENASQFSDWHFLWIFTFRKPCGNIEYYGCPVSTKVCLRGGPVFK